jgi:hypothetical protein
MWIDSQHANKQTSWVCKDNKQVKTINKNSHNLLHKLVKFLLIGKCPGNFQEFQLLNLQILAKKAIPTQQKSIQVVRQALVETTQQEWSWAWYLKSPKSNKNQ